MRDTAAAASSNLVLNGAFVGKANWMLSAQLLANITVIDDPDSPTGHALRKQTSERFQDPGFKVPVEAGRPYSFGAAIRTDGTPAQLIIHWRDAKDTTIDQVRTEIVTATTWTEAQIAAQVAPPEARSAVVLLSNLEPGTQEFTAVRAVVGDVVPPWSDALQRINRALDSASSQDVPVPTSSHNTFLRLVVETGVLGFLTLLTYLLLVGWSLWRTPGRSYWPLAFSLIVIAGLTIDTLHWRQLWVYAAVGAASFSALPSRKIRTRVAEALPSPRPMHDGLRLARDAIAGRGEVPWEMALVAIVLPRLPEDNDPVAAGSLVS
jgi:hypothetical protein